MIIITKSLMITTTKSLMITIAKSIMTTITKSLMITTTQSLVITFITFTKSSLLPPSFQRTGISPLVEASLLE